ncbi:hypothetical protein ACQUW5_06170 [Legionella sp. CNM-1927-20]|uniref:hypothetical protein n=1 Tax=Legionella sp. CNM-1927-20 TaxID=3422221 RepID=UPI00403B2D82
MDHLHQDQKRGQIKPNPMGDWHDTPEHEQVEHYSAENLHHKQFSQKPWYKRAKQRFIELFHDSRDKVSDTQHTIKDYSNTAVEKFVARPMPYLLATSAIGFLLSSMLHQKKDKKAHLHQESMKDRLMKNLPHKYFGQKPLLSRIKDQVNESFYGSRDKISEAQDTIKDYSDTALQKVSEKPLPFLLMASGLGFLLSSVFRQKEIKVVHVYQEQDHNRMKQNTMEDKHNVPHQEHAGRYSIENLPNNLQFGRRPVPYLLIAGTVGFLLSSMFYRK